MTEAFAGFRTFRLSTAAGVEIAGKIAGEGTKRPPLLLLHGHPQTHMIWHKLAGQLALHYTVVLADLRGYGASSKPVGLPDHSNYSKRAMAADMVAVMRQLGFAQFAVCAHDRGARVTHRMCMDFPEVVTQAMLLDICPTLSMYQQTDRTYATAYFHWFFLIQEAPFPETLISAAPDAYVEKTMGSRHAGLTPFTPAALAAYKAALRQPGAVHSMCEDYRAANTIDLVHDQADRDAGRKVQCPLHVLWGQYGVVEKCFQPIAEWQAVAERVSGHSVPCGHYIPEELPEQLCSEIRQFFPT